MIDPKSLPVLAADLDALYVERDEARDVIADTQKDLEVTEQQIKLKLAEIIRMTGGKHE